MFNTSNCGYSLSDIAAASGTNKSGGFFGDESGWWIILLFLFAGGWGNGFGGNNAGGTIREEISYGFDMNGLENSVRGVQQGLCDGFYAMNTGMLNGFNGVTSGITTATADILQTINADTVANMQNTNTIVSGLNNLGTQMAQCCCDLRYENSKNFSDLGYAIATQSCDTRRTITDSTRDIIESNNNGVKAILDFLVQDKIAALTAENQNLKFAASQAAQNAFITANQEAQTAELIRRLGGNCGCGICG